MKRLKQLLLVSMLMPVIANAASYNPVAPQINIPVSTVINGGWKECFRETYSSSGTTLANIQANCSGENLMLACRLTGSNTLQVLAQAPRADVLFDTGTGNTPHNANGTSWYYNNSYSWGFAKRGDPINRYSCDTDTSGNNNARLCWHTGSNNINGGWRCGADTYLNNSGAYERIIYQTASKLAAPTGLKVTQNPFKLEWDAVPDATAYRFAISQDKEFKGFSEKLDESKCDATCATFRFLVNPSDVKYTYEPTLVDLYSMGNSYPKTGLNFIRIRAGSADKRNSEWAMWPFFKDPSDTCKAGTTPLPNVTEFPCLLRKKGWDLAANLMSYWFGGSGDNYFRVSLEDVKKLKPNAVKVINELESQTLFKDSDYRRYLESELKNYKCPDGVAMFSTSCEFDFISTEMKILHKGWEEKKVEDGYLHFIADVGLNGGTTIDHYVAAFNRSALRLVVKGKVEVFLNQTPKITVTHGAVYFRDSYDFVDEGSWSQFLGCWRYADPYISVGNPLLATCPKNNNWLPVFNSAFRNYNILNSTQKGADFRIFSLPEKSIFPYKKQPSWNLGE